jgi:hypothetical protein
LSAVSSDSKATRWSGFPAKVARYLRSPSTRLAAFAGLLTYLCYAYAHSSWTNPALIGVAIFFAVFMPTYNKLSNKAELWANNQFGFVTGGRLGRFAPQFAFNLAVFAVMLWGGGMSRTGVATVGGIAGAALITSLASQGLQYLGSFLFARGIGDLNRNVLVGLCINIAVTALGTAGLPYAREAFLVLGFGLGGSVLLVGILSDLRSIFAPRGGIGLFFGDVQSVSREPPRDPQARDGRAATRQDHHPSDPDPAAACRGLPQGRDPRRADRGRLPDLREDREGRRQRRLLSDRPGLPAA